MWKEETRSKLNRMLFSFLWNHYDLLVLSSTFLSFFFFLFFFFVCFFFFFCYRFVFVCFFCVCECVFWVQCVCAAMEVEEEDMSNKKREEQYEKQLEDGNLLQPNNNPYKCAMAIEVWCHCQRALNCSKGLLPSPKVFNFGLFFIF